MVLLTVILPYLPLGAAFGFVPLPGPVLIAILGITVLYIMVSEFTKHIFFQRFSKQHRKNSDTASI